MAVKRDAINFSSIFIFKKFFEQYLRNQTKLIQVTSQTLKYYVLKRSC